jgi:hypothetical protein
VSLTANWRWEIRERWGIEVLENADSLPEAVMWTTRCSKTKNGVDRGRPKDLYVSPINRYFYRWAEKEGVRYGVLSDKYGLHLDTEELDYYDVHPSGLDSDDKVALGRLIRQKLECMGIVCIVFYSPSPLMSIPYFEMLYHSELETIFTTRLRRKT